MTFFYILMTFVMSENLNVVLYVDDTSHYTTHNDIDILNNRTNNELKKLYNWLY